MILKILDDCNDYLWSRLEQCLIPRPDESVSFTSACQTIPLLYLGMCTGCWVGVKKVASYVASFFYQKKIETKDFSAVLEDSRLWNRLGDIEQDLLQNPPQFKFGAVTCTYQDSGVEFPYSQWTQWQNKVIKDPSNRSTPQANLVALYKTPEGQKQITDRLHQLGVTTYRLSIEWSALQPQKDVWNLDHLQVLVEFCKHCRDEGIDVAITMHHFSEPAWFHDLGSFENENNIPHFVQFCEKIFPSLTQEYQGKPLVECFWTINEPAIEAFSRYVLGSFSPGCVLNFKRAGLFLKGAFKAHAAVYETLKRQAPPSVQIGVVHQYLKFIPKTFFMIPIARYFTHLINDVSLNYFKTGTFELKVPFCHLLEKGPKPKADIVGVQYYARPVIGFGPTSYHEPMTQMPFREDPEGLFEAIIETHRAFQIPVMVTENGISTHDDVQRNRYMLRALYAAREAAKVINPANLWGYFVWSLGDNLEWNMGMKPQAFGAYALTGQGLAEKPKPGMTSFIKIAEAWKKLKSSF